MISRAGSEDTKHVVIYKVLIILRFYFLLIGTP